MRQNLSAKLFLGGISDPLPEWLNPDEELNLRRAGTLFYPSPHLDLSAQLQIYVAWGNQAEAEAILGSIENDEKKLSALLCNEVTNNFSEPSGKVVKDLTLFQIALCAGDIEMCEMFKGYFAKIDDGLEIMQVQFDTIFPEGVDAHVKNQKEQAIGFEEMLEGLMRIIIAASDDEVDTMLEQKQAGSILGQAFSIFRREVEEISYSEWIFNPYYLLGAFEIYWEYFDAIRSWKQSDLFCIQVIGFMQRYLPACYLQAFSQSLDDLVKKRAPLRRSFKFSQVSNGVKFLHIDPVSSFSGLGFHYWVSNGQANCYAEDLFYIVSCCYQDDFYSADHFSKFLSNKNSRFSKLTHYSPGMCSRCVIL